MILPTIADLDPWLEPYRSRLEWQQAYIHQKSREILSGKSVSDFALGHLYFGLHKVPGGWVIREWAPNATAMYVISEASNWQDEAEFAFIKLEHGVWELLLPSASLKHLQHYKLHIHWPGGSGERLPSYATYVVQDENTKLFDAVVWQPRAYSWRHDSPASPSVPLIYEAHIGMSGDREAVTTYGQFAKEVLPRIADLGYNTIQLMAIQEHPYYGSYGYHVSNLFAASSRFGTPSDLKKLIDTAHGMGIGVIMDIVHSHAVKNENEGLSRFDGTLTQYFHEGERGNHTAWDSRVFDYGKPEVAHFLLSNLRFWLDEYRFDGFRFDGVTSMLYHNHGLEQAFSSYDDYVSGNVEIDALTYLTLANNLIHEVRSDALVVAEDMSAFPGLAAPSNVGGVGFDYRLSMGVPDLWIKLLKDTRYEDWGLGGLFHELTNHRAEERTISYAESHDQALVGDKTIIFRLMDSNMYDHMSIGDPDERVEWGMALHKMIRLLTASTHSGGYLNFMGNEFGHPEWIDFPREGNDWSYKYARRQWKLVDSKKLKYQYLNNFDKAMIGVIKRLTDNDYHYVEVHEERRTLSYIRSSLVFIYNFSPFAVEYSASVMEPGEYSVLLSSEDSEFGGKGQVAERRVGARDGRIIMTVPGYSAIVLGKEA